MDKQDSLMFALDSELNNRLNASSIPKSATIFYYAGRWLYELRSDEVFNEELDRQKESFDWIAKSAIDNKFASGPFNFQPVNISVECFKKGNRFLYSIISINDRQLVRPLQGTCSPITDLTFLPESAHDQARIPTNATHYCWLNPLNIEDSEGTEAQANEAAALLLGGLAYFTRDKSNTYRSIQINRFVLTSNGHFEYQGPKKWFQELTKILDDQGRFGISTHMHFVVRDIRHAAFINANEEFVDPLNPENKYTPTQTGGFVYLFNEDKSPHEQDGLYELKPIMVAEEVSNDQ